MTWQSEVSTQQWEEWLILARKLSKSKKVITSLGPEDYAAQAIEKLVSQENRPPSVEGWLALTIKRQYIDRFKKIQARGGASNRELSDDEWEIKWNRTLQVNLNTPVQLIKWAIPMWEKRKQGIHIVISSRAAYRGETEQYASYAASKSGIIGVSKTIARGFGERGITSFAVAPGFTMTDMLKEAIPVYGEAYMKRENVLGEIAPTDDVADLCVLLSEGKLKHMTGQTFHINSGSYML